ncbi:DUF962 domain-containing protein [Mycobacteroides abscessus]|uniref:hypothetical protein n=1 Tax=Mycobacteroides abscessus TaxID=36809 RepID=UPI00092C3DEF|nr:hypothetical protein [Mycobacteroides abscessus]MBN7548405.1 hypothetical protein [Mycobacteroides abscessus subsp. abscessus]MDM2692271.1 hypothetical protein [Mycobacteroides abscessus]MDM2697083.1 hypothetical protein [Mycobacteroides abscessus]MDM2702193.1 hypothetical protein [Mycobacteroides abscessus]MDO3265682.1 hypothetical protein [Mycobacteroides abscessus subsp. abscessus]
MRFFGVWGQAKRQRCAGNAAHHHATTCQAPFDWHVRMGIHEAYHQSRGNRWVHWVSIPIEMFATITLLSLWRWGESIDFGLLTILALGVIYVTAEPVLGTALSALMVAMWWLARALTPQPHLCIGILSVAVVAIAFVAQLRVGHALFEGGRDDTELNLREFKRTHNPIPLLLVFFYHYVDVAFRAGYRPAVRKCVARYAAAELAAEQ